jgi:demethylmenaquinone methyltransferase/2-methoxy-6-polyprenyl-1,4-benzoquinol methylase
MQKPSSHESWRMFDRISSSYDLINRVLSLGMDRRWRKKAASFLPHKERLRLLDLATGTGDQLIASFESGASVGAAVCIDLSAEMLQRAEEKLRQKSYCAQVEWMRADAQMLPFPEESFDAATFSFGIRNVPDPLASLKEIHRVLKPEGRCLILEFSLPPQPIRAFYLLYLRHLLPRIGGWLSKDRSAYRYLNETIESFPYGRTFAGWMNQAGFQRVRIVRLALGGVSLYIGEKTE